jgi:hypothetical protein
MRVLITLTTAGSDSGPLFDLYSNSTGPWIKFEDNVPKSALLAGYTSDLVPNGTTSIRVQSEGVCVNYIDIIISTPPTTTQPPIPVTITRDGACGFSQISTNYNITGPVGTVLEITTTWSGSITRSGGAQFPTKANLSAPGGSDGTQCYSDFNPHSFSFNIVGTYTITGSGNQVNTSAVTHNSSESMTGLPTVTITKINGVSSNISTSGCRGNSSGSVSCS